ncbi:MAG: putative iron-sulfur cluster-binding metallochaperone [Blastocatellia bacterium]
MNCCLPDNPNEISVGDAESLSADPANSPAPRSCPGCRRASRPVTRRTILFMLKPSLFDRAGERSWRFCADPECRVVYFTGNGEAVITTDDLRVRVGLKEREDPIPLCYCFGFDEADARDEIARTGRSAIPQRITALVKEGLCACETRNPSGSCCLGEVNKVVRRLRGENPGA